MSNCKKQNLDLDLVGVCWLAGFWHVIRTQWSIGDHAAPLVVYHVYDWLTEHDAGDLDTALHDAVTSLRAQNHYWLPMHWVPYGHIGP